MATESWAIRISRLESRLRQLILEGYASRLNEPLVSDEVLLLMLVGPDYLSLEVSHDLQGEQLLAHFKEHLGVPATQPRIIVGSHEGEEGALLMVEWHFSTDRRPEMLERLRAFLGHPLAGTLPSSPT